MGRLCRVNALFHALSRVTIFYVIGDRVMKEEDLLTHNTYLFAQRLNRHLADIHPVNGDAAACHIIETGNEIQ